MLKNIVKYINKIVHFYELVRTVFLNFSFIKYTDVMTEFYAVTSKPLAVRCISAAVSFLGSRDRTPLSVLTFIVCICFVLNR